MAKAHAKSKNWLHIVTIALAILFALVASYFLLTRLGVLPTYQCGSTMGPNGPVSWCVWAKGTVVG